MPDTDILLNGNTFKVVCDDGSIREYPAGENLGNFAASVTTLATGDYILNHTVSPENVTVLPDGTKRLKLFDTKKGFTRELDADAVFFINGREKMLHDLQIENHKSFIQIKNADLMQRLN